jgi:O-antigen biosynthesis protein
VSDGDGARDARPESLAHEPMALSVVIPAYGGDAELARCLEAAERELARADSPRPAEIVVADDATPGGLDPKLMAAHPDVRFVIATENLGFAGNANRGVAATSGRILCLLNTDMYVDEGYFRGCLEAFEDPRLFAVTGRIEEPGGRNDGFKELSLGGTEVKLSHVDPNDPRLRQPGVVPYANGGGSFFNRALFDELGGFDPIFCPYYWEDTDLGYRAWKRGYRISYDPRRSLRHDHQSTISKQGRNRIRRIFRRNRRLFVWRNNTSVALPGLFWKMSARPALEAMVRLRFVRCWEYLGDLRLLGRVVAARRSAFRNDVRSDAQLAMLWRQGGHMSSSEGAS